MQGGSTPAVPARAIWAPEVVVRKTKWILSLKIKLLDQVRKPACSGEPQEELGA